MDMGLVLFYYTLFVLLAVILTAAACIASYLVSHTKALLYAFFGFLFYFFDVALVFQDDFMVQRSADLAATPFFIGSPVASIIIGGGALMSFWLVVCEYIEERRLLSQWLPGLAFVLGSVATLLLMEPGNVQEFFFYSMRELMMYWMLIYAAVVYAVSDDEVRRIRMKRFRKLYLCLWILATLVLLENVLFLLIVGPSMVAEGLLPFFPQRNFAENLLVLCCAFVACRGSWRNLSLRHADPPTQGGESLQGFIEHNLGAYTAARRLSKREEDVLRLVLLGKDNQNIATTLSLAPGTVKVHMHHILQKTGKGNRKELMQDFWEFS
ncbi:helix-turn-helix transcriptional regulator [Paraeggerthella hongkongensis]|uniref:LuxR family transcriptional regulator n=1 Tax=Paraeggerthella hongkongensis TaxID=230658 RepID=A0A3N0BJX2_9ACTN|nr:helix-turn-helix transcriptional regulator [Paraeggerthella hongkongensis]RNL48305.1 LuxR family transcriptional regulator [Paraeggerthella hongkongensis]